MKVTVEINEDRMRDTGDGKLSFEYSFTEFPQFGTFGAKIDKPANIGDLKLAIVSVVTDRAAEIKQQVIRDTLLKEALAGAVKVFEVDV